MAQLLPTLLCEEATDVFAGLLKGRVPSTLSDEYFTRDWSSLWDELVRDGWMTIADPVSGEFSLLDLAAFAQVWGRYLVPLPFVPTLVARRALSVHSRQDSLPDPAVRLGYAVAEGDWNLVQFGGLADQVLTGDMLVPPAEPIASDDWAASAPIAVMAADRAPVSSEVAVEGAILATAEAAGAAAAAMDRAVEYAKVREQFGQPIGKFQAVKHILANMHCSRELAASALAWACADPQNVGGALRSALGHSLLVAEKAVQVHGAIGYTWEGALHRYYRHVMSMRRLVLAAVGEAA